MKTSRLKRRVSEAASFRRDLEVFLSVCEGVNTPRSQACFMLAQAGEWGQYLDLTFPDTENSTFPDDYLVSEMMRKHQKLPYLGIDTARVAKDKFLLAEERCRETNQRLREYQEGRELPDSEVQDILDKAMRLISSTLGPLTRAKLDFSERHFSFGPGATSSVSGRNVMLSRKYTCSMHVTPRLYPYWRSLIVPTWGREVTDISLRSSSKVITVPKNSKTDRTICVEPHLNIFVQKGFGALIRRQLLLSGLDLNTQVNNQRLASKAGKLGLATLDLESASDCVSRELVWLLLPFDWAALLDLARTEYVELDGKEILLEKFSAMGNGFTFELESLIFWALASSVDPMYGTAYGDDIILKTDSADLLIRVLKFLGFSVNPRKSFLAGDFFESCGSDWWRGQNIRPFYLKGNYDDLKDIIVLRSINAICRYASLRGGGIYRDIRLLPAWLRLYSHLSQDAKRTYIPNGVGDGGVVRDFDDAAPSCVRQGATFIAWRGRVLAGKLRKSRRTDPVGCFLATLHLGTPETGSRQIEYERGAKPTARRLASQFVTEWPDLGPWY